MNFQASLALLLSVAAFAKGQDSQASDASQDSPDSQDDQDDQDKCEDQMNAAGECMGEDGWEKCMKCFESFLNDEDQDFGLEEENCDAMKANMSEAFDVCTNDEGACNDKCNDQLKDMIVCGMAQECGGYAANDFIVTIA